MKESGKKHTAKSEIKAKLDLGDRNRQKTQKSQTFDSS